MLRDGFGRNLTLLSEPSLEIIAYGCRLISDLYSIPFLKD